jgi:hypothetical protein
MTGNSNNKKSLLLGELKSIMAVREMFIIHYKKIPFHRNIISNSVKSLTKLGQLMTNLGPGVLRSAKTLSHM